jgi:hypothetical protein
MIDIRFIMTSSDGFGKQIAKRAPHPIPLPSACLPVGRGRGEGEGAFVLVDLYVSSALVLHGVNALHGLLDLAYLRKLLAHLEIDLKGLREFLGSVIGIRKADEHHGVV